MAWWCDGMMVWWCEGCVVTWGPATGHWTRAVHPQFGHRHHQDTITHVTLSLRHHHHTITHVTLSHRHHHHTITNVTLSHRHHHHTITPSHTSQCHTDTTLTPSHTLHCHTDTTKTMAHVTLSHGHHHDTITHVTRHILFCIRYLGGEVTNDPQTFFRRGASVSLSGFNNTDQRQSGLALKRLLESFSCYGGDMGAERSKKKVISIWQKTSVIASLAKILVITEYWTIHESAERSGSNMFVKLGEGAPPVFRCWVAAGHCHESRGQDTGRCQLKYKVSSVLYCAVLYRTHFIRC